MSNIDDIDKQLIFELDRNARLSEKELGKRIGKSRQATRYRMKKLEETGIILRYATWIDPIRLGYQSGKIYLTLANLPKRKRELIDYVVQDQRLFWMGIADGAWNAGITFFVKTNQEFYEIKQDLFTRFQDIILDSKTAALVSVHLYGKTYLYPKARPVERVLFREPGNEKIDELDKHILAEIHHNARYNAAAIAHKYGKSSTTILERIKNLEQRGIITGHFLMVDFHKLGFDFYKGFLYFKTLTEDDLKRVLSYCKQEAAIRYVVKQISPWDLEIEAMCASYQEYNEMLNRLTEKFSDIIRKVETAIISEDYILESKKPVFYD